MSWRSDRLIARVWCLVRCGFRGCGRAAIRCVFSELFTFETAARPGKDKSDGDGCGDGGFAPRRYDHAGCSCLLIVRLIAERRHHGTKTMPDLGVHEQHIRALAYVDKLGDKTAVVK